jgi:hypothetical protein
MTGLKGHLDAHEVLRVRILSKYAIIMSANPVFEK